MIVYLYVKEHQITGLKYFGRTTCNDPLKYTGSGKYWKNHLNKHGYDVITTNLWKFNNLEECSTFAIQFSLDNNIVTSNEWANLIPENGLQGAISGISHLTDAGRSILSEKMKINNPMTIIRSHHGSFQPGVSRPYTLEHKRKQSVAKLGSKNPNYNKPETSNRLNKRSACNICGAITNIGNLKRWHKHL